VDTARTWFSLPARPDTLKQSFSTSRQPRPRSDVDGSFMSQTQKRLESGRRPPPAIDPTHAEDPARLMRALEEKGEETVESVGFENARSCKTSRGGAGYRVTPHWRIGTFRIELVVEATKRLAIECEGPYHSARKASRRRNGAAIRYWKRMGWIFTRIRQLGVSPQPCPRDEARLRKSCSGSRSRRRWTPRTRGCEAGLP